jgi:hypothetical protein
MTFKDHFSGHADDYDAYRPSYPDALFEWLASVAPARGRVWDCATGNGQAAKSLVRYFQSVIATDASENQLSKATPQAGIEFRVAPAERAPIDDHSIDLVTVAQALHWLSLPEFYAEVRRVARPQAVFAAWCYQIPRVDPAIDALTSKLYRDIVGTYWTPERRHVEAGYATLDFPFAVIQAPPIAMTSEWDLDHFVGYLGTWSASQAYKRAVGADPVTLIEDELAAAWGEPNAFRTLTWPLDLSVGRVVSS